MSSIGLKLESDKDNDEDSEKDKEMDWGLYFSLLKNRGFSHEEILNLSYPQFNVYMNNINIVLITAFSSKMLNSFIAIYF